MFRTSCFVGCCAAAFALAGGIMPVQAQVKPAPVAGKTVPINIVHGGVDRLYADIDYIFGLANEPKELKNLKDTLDVFFIGNVKKPAMDTKRPTVFRVYVRKGKFNTVLFAPTAGAVPFRDNIRALGVKTRNLGTGWFAVAGLFNGFLKEGGNISIIAEDRADAVPLEGVMPVGDLVAFNKKINPQDYDFYVSIENAADQLKDREAAIDELRKQVIPGLKASKTETPARFLLRTLTIDQQITELKQIYSEAATITSFIDLTPKNKTFISTTELTCLPDTDLLKTVESLAAEPSYFANIPRNETEPLSALINLKVDTVRQKHVKAFLDLARPIFHTEVKDADTISAKTKEYTDISIDIIVDVLQKGAADGIFDSFMNIHANAGGLHTMVGGTRVDGAIVKAGLEKLKAAAKVELDTAKIGDVDLHKITLPADMTELHEIYGKDLVLLIGTSPKAVWYALGEKAEDKLKEAIEKVAQPAPATDHVVIHVHGKALLVMQQLDAHRSKHKKGDADIRKQAIEIFKKGGDDFDLKVEKVGEKHEKLKSTLTLHEGILHYFGKVVAKFVKENLQN